MKEAGNERQESLSYGKIGYRSERSNIAHSFLQCEQSHEFEILTRCDIIFSGASGRPVGS